MSLFSKKENTNKWEKKFFSLLDEHDSLKKSYQDNEALLCKTIIRLSLVASGFNAELDPYLTRIRKLLNNGLKSDQLRLELEEFIKALMTLDESSTGPSNDDPIQLLEFLIKHYPNRQSDLAQVYNQYRNDQGLKLNDLLLTLHELVDEEQSRMTEDRPSGIDESVIKERLVHLLEATDIPQQFSEQTEQLKIDLLNDEEPLASILEGAFLLLLQIKNHNRIEQQKMAEFLTQLSKQLAELGQNVAGVTNAHENSFKQRHLLNQSFSEQMLGLQQSSSEATQLEPLRQLVISGLDSIEQQLRRHQQLEQTEREQHQMVLHELTTKIQRLESESGQLKNKLDIAQHKAIYDPLTELPNRLAYDERLKLEVARMKRNRTPLSMVIWDIDLFKKINDNFGHKAGDKTLKIIAQLLKEHCRETDFISRFGGEEFIMLLPDTGVQSALVIAEKLRKLIATTGFSANGRKIAITISCGISEFTEKDSGESVFKKADGALYNAKKNGRNRCEVA